MFERSAKKLTKQHYKVWQDDYHPIAFIPEEWFQQKYDYLHDNPVRKGFVELTEHWKYSSAGNWRNDDNRIIEIDRQVLL